MGAGTVNCDTLYFYQYVELVAYAILPAVYPINADCNRIRPSFGKQGSASKYNDRCGNKRDTDSKSNYQWSCKVIVASHFVSWQIASNKILSKCKCRTVLDKSTRSEEHTSELQSR